MAKKLKIFTDGGSRGNPGIAGLGVYVEDESGQELYREAKFLGNKTNNEAEYLGFLVALEYLIRFNEQNPGEIESVDFFLDSKLVVEQINKNWKIKKDHLRQIAENAWQKMSLLPFPIRLSHVLRDKNKIADQLANDAMDGATSQA